jgi:primosomal protein N'
MDRKRKRPSLVNRLRRFFSPALWCPACGEMAGCSPECPIATGHATEDDIVAPVAFQEDDHATP